MTLDFFEQVARAPGVQGWVWLWPLSRAVVSRRCTGCGFDMWYLLWVVLMLSGGVGNLASISLPMCGMRSTLRQHSQMFLLVIIWVILVACLT